MPKSKVTPTKTLLERIQEEQAAAVAKARDVEKQIDRDLEPFRKKIEAERLKKAIDSVLINLNCQTFDMPCPVCRLRKVEAPVPRITLTDDCGWPICSQCQTQYFDKDLKFLTAWKKKYAEAGFYPQSAFEELVQEFGEGNVIGIPQVWRYGERGD